MSGTAMDGIDAALIETDGVDYIKPIAFETEIHDASFRTELKRCLNRTDRHANDIRAVEREFTARQIKIIDKLLLNNNMLRNDVDVIGFHGQTTHHDPSDGSDWSSSSVKGPRSRDQSEGPLDPFLRMRG